MIHAWHLVKREQWARNPLGGVLVTNWYRFACVCGEQTTWQRDLRRAWSLTTGHAIDGQQSFDGMGDA